MTALGKVLRLAGSLSIGDPLDRWVRIESNGTITVFTGKVELGQGIHGALAQLVADELDVPVDRVQVAPVDTSYSPDEGTTSASRSIEDSGAAVRQVAAELRLALLEAAAVELAVPVEQLSIERGVISTAGGARLAYEELATHTLVARRATGKVGPKPRDQRILIGGSVPRRDLPAKVSGRPAYVQDLDLPGMLHGRVIRPPGYHARLTSVDQEAIRSIPGIVSVVRDGSFLAVIADREERAVAALTRARRATEWDAGPALPSTADPRYLLSLPAEEIIVSQRDAVPHIDPVRRVEAEYSRPYLAHGAVGPSCAVARLEGGDYTVWTHSQGIFALRHELASVLRVGDANVRVIHLEGSGCYGHNGADDVALDAALLARAVPGRPVRVQWMRDDEFAWEPFGPAGVVRLSAGVTSDGDITEWRHDGWGHTHDGRPSRDREREESSLLAAQHLERPFRTPGPSRPETSADGGQRNAIPAYLFPSELIVDHYVADAPLRGSALRSLGAHLNVFAIESFVDEVAAVTGRDPIELRLRYLPDPRARATIEAVAGLAGWVPSERGDGERGRGIGFAQYKNKAAYAAVVVEVDLDKEIRVRRAWAAIDAGMVVSRDGLVNQVEGGIVQAISWTLHEAVRTDEATILTRGWDAYRTLRFPESPDVVVGVLDRPDEPPLGAGEALTGPTAAAIANAVYNATGLRVRDMPLTRERVIAAMG